VRPYACVLDIAQIPDGAHAFEIAGYDTLGNVTILAYSLQVSLAVPPAPVITAPVNGFVTNSAELLVQGQAARDSLIQLFLNGQPAGAQKAVDSQGRFSLSLTLGEGTHQLQASAANRSGSGPLCSAVTVTLDTSVPQEPKYLFAQAVETGQVRLSWKAPDDAGIKTYNLYRHSATFSAPADAVKVNNNPITKTDYLDLPPGEGTWYYRVAAVNAAQNQSALSNESSTESDNTLPRAVSIEYAPQGNVDPISGAVAPGRVDLTLTVSELLMAMPFLSITPERGVPIAVTLRQVTPITYSGHFEIESITPSGTAYAIFSGRDKAGNRGTEIDSGQTLLIDASGPAVRRLDLSPATPIRNDQQAPVTVAATIGLSEPVRSGSAPELDYILSGPADCLLLSATWLRVRPRPATPRPGRAASSCRPMRVRSMSKPSHSHSGPWTAWAMPATTSWRPTFSRFTRAICRPWPPPAACAQNLCPPAASSWPGTPCPRPWPIGSTARDPLKRN
jgi:large repetitive protein